MKRVLVIADDLSGAAEIAGVALRHGLATRLVREDPARAADEAGCMVVDTDSRSLPPADAVRRVARFAEPLAAESFDLVYKKTDSVLRGPVRAEVEALMATFGRTATLLLPQNPSRGRTVQNGEYRLNGAPLHTTAFGKDPEHPATSSDVLELLGDSDHHEVRCLECGMDLPRDGITIGAATSAEEVRQWSSLMSATVLPAGGADFFTTLLALRGLNADPNASRAKLADGRTLFVCGSTAAYGEELIARAQREGVVVCPMSDDLDTWRKSIGHALRDAGRVLVTIRRPLDRTPGAAQRLQAALAETVARVLERDRRVANVLLEGGATASAVCQRMGWSAFEVRGELDAGVVQMRVPDGTNPDGIHLVIKPGSYRWPDSVWG